MKQVYAKIGTHPQTVIEIDMNYTSLGPVKPFPFLVPEARIRWKERTSVRGLDTPLENLPWEYGTIDEVSDMRGYMLYRINRL